jgi:YD repeat-containing protein
VTACPALTYGPVTRAAVVRLTAAALADYGVTIAADAGTVTQDGFSIQWSYDEASQVLTVTCTDSPWWASCDEIAGVISAEVGKCLPSP